MRSMRSASIRSRIASTPWSSFAYFYAGDYDSALSFVQRAIELKPQFTMGHALLGRTEAERGNWDRAIAAFHRGLELAGDSAFLKALLAYGHAGSGDAHTANQILHEVELERGDACFPACDVSAVHTILNHENEALQNISKAYDMRDIKMTWIHHDPRFTTLRASQQFHRICGPASCCDVQELTSHWPLGINATARVNLLLPHKLTWHAISHVFACAEGENGDPHAIR